MPKLLLLSVILVHLVHHYSCKNTSFVLITMNDNRQILSKLEGRDKTATNIEGTGRRQGTTEEEDYDYYYDSEEEYDETRECSHSRECGFNSICDKKLEICVCRRRVFGKYPRIGSIIILDLTKEKKGRGEAFFGVCF